MMYSQYREGEKSSTCLISISFHWVYLLSCAWKQHYGSKMADKDVHVLAELAMVLSNKLNLKHKQDQSLSNVKQVMCSSFPLISCQDMVPMSFRLNVQSFFRRVKVLLVESIEMEIDGSTGNIFPRELSSSQMEIR